MGTQSYSLRREQNRWIVCAAGSELMACADKRMALRIIKAAAALNGHEAPYPKAHLPGSGGSPNSSQRRATAAMSVSLGHTFGGKRAPPRSGSGS